MVRVMVRVMWSSPSRPVLDPACVRSSLQLLQMWLYANACLAVRKLVTAEVVRVIRRFRLLVVALGRFSPRWLRVSFSYG